MVSIETRSETLPDADNQIARLPFDNSDDKPLSISEDAPDGGRRAWLVAAGAAFITFASLGYANSVGVFQEYYLSHQLKGQSPDDVAWIGSIAAFLQFAVGTLAGPMFDRYGAKVTLVHTFATLRGIANFKTDHPASCSPIHLLRYDDESL